MPCLSSALCTAQHGCAWSFTKVLGHRCSLIAIAPSSQHDGRAIKRGGLSREQLAVERFVALGAAGGRERLGAGAAGGGGGRVARQLDRLEQRCADVLAVEEATDAVVAPAHLGNPA